MDRIVELILIFYLISIFLRFLKKGQKSKDRQPFPYPRPTRPAPPPPPSPTTTRRGESMPQPWPRPSSRRVVEMPRRPVFTSKKDQDALDILAEWERRARGQRAETQTEGATEGTSGHGTPLEEVRVSTVERPAKRPSPDIVPGEDLWRVQPGVQEIKTEALQAPPTPSPAARPEIYQEESAEEEMPFLGHPAMLWQGIVISEILRPPLARRSPFSWPYLQG